MEHASLEPTPPPPELPELPEGAGPRWPPWYAGVGFLVALILTLVVVGIAAAATGATTDDENPTFTVVATFLQGVIFIGTAVLFASFAGKPRARQFGLRPSRFWPTVGWAALGLFSFYILAALYTAIVQPDAEQTVAQDLGADQGTLGMIAAGFMVICVAPVAEEFFFRGFFYGALRTRFGIAVAAIIDGLVFGLIHFEGSAEGLLIVPPLAVLGIVFCLVYEKTRSLYPVVGLHSLNNSIAYAAQADGGAVSLVLGPLMLAACALAPRLARPAPAPLRGSLVA